MYLKMLLMKKDWKNAEDFEQGDPVIVVLKTTRLFSVVFAKSISKKHLNTENYQKLLTWTLTII